MRKVKNSGVTQVYKFSLGGTWQQRQVHGKDVWVDAKRRYVRYSPRIVALAGGLCQFWFTNRGNQFPWRESLSGVRYFVRPLGRITHDEYNKAKEYIRECGSRYLSPTGKAFVYASTRGTWAKSGFVEEAAEALAYEDRNHTILKVMEGRIENGTVETAGTMFGLQVVPDKIKTSTLR